MKIINVILIDNNRLVRDGITEIIDREPDLKLLVAFGKSKKAQKKVSELQPDVLLVGLDMLVHDSIIFLDTIKKKCPETKVIVMDIVPIQKNILQYIEAGVSGFILKDATSDDLIKTIRSVANEETVLPIKLTRSLFSQIVENEVKQLETSKVIEKVSMTKVEREIVLLIASGMTNKEIAQKLQLSARLVKSHVHKILEKMILNTQIQFALYSPLSEELNPPGSSTPSKDR